MIRDPIFYQPKEWTSHGEVYPSGWYFWDEIYYVHGPYVCEWHARGQFREYCMIFLNADTAENMWKIWINCKKSDGTRCWKQMCSSNLKPYLYKSEEEANWSAHSLYPLAVYGEDIIISKDEPRQNPNPSANPFALTIL